MSVLAVAGGKIQASSKCGVGGSSPEPPAGFWGAGLGTFRLVAKRSASTVLKIDEGKYARVSSRRARVRRRAVRRKARCFWRAVGRRLRRGGFSPSSGAAAGRVEQHGPDTLLGDLS